LGHNLHSGAIVLPDEPYGMRKMLCRVAGGSYNEALLMVPSARELGISGKIAEIISNFSGRFASIA